MDILLIMANEKSPRMATAQSIKAQKPDLRKV
jgi:hypothetical protein